MNSFSVISSGGYVLHIVVFFSVFFSGCVHAWGERGHDIVARLAVRHLVEQQEKKLYVPFLQREFMLGHLSNVPDIIWKSDVIDARARESNRPTHYINLDLLNANPASIADIPRAFAAYRKAVRLKMEVSAAQLGVRHGESNSYTGLCHRPLQGLVKQNIVWR